MARVRVETGGVQSAGSGAKQAADALSSSRVPQALNEIAGAMPGGVSASAGSEAGQAVQVVLRYLAQACEIYGQSLKAASANYDAAERSNTVRN
jgi:hypothetical protein